MKKLLSILASVTLTASASTAVVSCSTESSTKGPESYVNNNLNNILGASLEKAKSVIINNEYGVDPSKVLEQQANLKVNADGLKNIDYRDLANKNSSTVSELVNQYYGNIDDTNSNTNTGSNVDIDGTNGVTSTIDYLLQKVMNTLSVPSFVQNAIFRYKGLIIDQLGLSKGTVNMSSLNDMNSDMYNQAISGGEYLINTGITLGLNALSKEVKTEKDAGKSGWGIIVADIIKKIFSAKDTFSDTTLPGVFGNKTTQMVKGVLGSLFNGQDSSYTQPSGINSKASSPSPIQNAVYFNSDIQMDNFTSSNNGGAKTLDDTKGTKVSLKTDYLDRFNKIQDGWESDILSKVNVTDIHKEILASVDRILHTVINPTLFADQTPNKAPDKSVESDPTDYTTKFITDLQDSIAKIVSGLINGQVNTNTLFNTDLLKDQASLMGLVYEGLRDISLMNAQFSMFEDKYDVHATDSQHLFGLDDNNNAQTNYQYLNGLVNDNNVDPKNPIKAKYSTLSTTPYLKAGDEPINLNYFFSNLNYYLGELNSKDDESVYRVQKLLFILFNDPTKSMMADGSTNPDGWIDKQSDLLDFIIQTGVKVGTAYVDAKDAIATGSDKETYDIVKAALDSITKADIINIENGLLKPLILGLVNGDSIQSLLKLLDGALKGALKVDSLKKLFGSLKALGIDVNNIEKAIDRLVDNEKIGNDTIHSLFSVDFRSILKPLKIIPQAWMDKLFGPDLPVNLMTLANMPLSKILSMLNVPGFEGGKVSPIGDYFTLHSIPWLVNFMNGRVLNNIEDINKVPLEYVSYGTGSDGKANTTPDFSKSLKARDINFQALYDLFISIVGTNNTGKYAGATDNIFSRLMHDLVNSNVNGDDPKSWSIQLDPSKTVHDLGIMKQVQKSAPITPNNQMVFADADSPLPDGKYDDNAKTIEFDSDEITADWKLEQPAPVALQGDPDISAGKIVLHLANSIERAKPYNLEFNFTNKDGKTITGKVTIPPLFGGAGTDLQIQYNSITGAFYRLNLPEIEQNQPDIDGTKTFTMNDGFLNVDFLKTDYDNIVDLIRYFNSPGDYLKFIKDILRNQDAFNFDYDPESVRYFASNRNLIKGLTFTVTYKNYVVGETNQYIFTVSRDSNIEAFKIDKLITNKTD